MVAILIVLEQGWKKQPKSAKQADKGRNPHCTGAGLEGSRRLDDNEVLVGSRNPHCTGAGLEASKQGSGYALLRRGRNPHCTGAGLEVHFCTEARLRAFVAILIVLEQGWK